MLAHGRTYPGEDVYGERRDNEQASACESVGMAHCAELGFANEPYLDPEQYGDATTVSMR